jgi:hypothetical protein
VQAAQHWQINILQDAVVHLAWEPHDVRRRKTDLKTILKCNCEMQYGGQTQDAMNSNGDPRLTGRCVQLSGIIEVGSVKKIEVMTMQVLMQLSLATNCRFPPPSWVTRQPPRHCR